MKIWGFSFEHLALEQDNIKYTLDDVEILLFFFLLSSDLVWGEEIKIQGVHLTFGIVLYHVDPNLFISPL